jgi:hypothetical protein
VNTVVNAVNLAKQPDSIGRLQEIAKQLSLKKKAGAGDAKAPVECYLKAVRATSGYSWWVQIHWETLDNDGEMRPHDARIRVEGGTKNPEGIYGGTMQYKIELWQLQLFEDRLRKSNGLPPRR